MKKKIKDWIEKNGISFLRKIGIKPNQIILDFGARNGNYTIPAAKIVGKNGLVYALDKNKDRLDELISISITNRLKNIKIINTKGELKIPLKDKIVDVVLLYDVIHLVGKNDSSTIGDRKKLYKEVYKIAKNNALVSIYPNHLTTHTDISSIKEIKKELEEYFQFEKEFSITLIHDDNFINGKVLNFRKRI